MASEVNYIYNLRTQIALKLMKPIIPEAERSQEPLDTDRVIYHPDMIRANEWVLGEYEAPFRELCIFVPCSKKKPYHESPSHKKFDRVIFGIAKPEDVHIVTFGTCGITPRELDTQYPFMHYSFMMGKCNVTKVKRDFIKMESERLAAYLLKTRDNYKHRIAYCIGDFRTAMEKAAEMVDIEVNIVPKESTIQSMIQPEKKFIYSSLSTREYLQDLSDAITDALKLPGRTVGLREDLSVDDTDWYVL
jgi:predicted RNA-binding protein